MLLHARTRLASLGLASLLLVSAAGCGSSTAPDPVLVTENFTGTLEPGGSDFKTFSIVNSQQTTDLSVIVTSLVTVSSGTALPGPIGVGFGNVSGSTCVVQVQTTTALNTEQFTPNGASVGTYCVQIFDCQAGASCTVLPEAATYKMTVNHY